ncbi:MAG: hypothetical protein KDA65_01030 [Planctomycetaceae bacterium]|nr:hypothetical protein [Planctomycetaceae bacterium]
MMKKAVCLFVAMFGMMAYSEKSEAAGLSDILGIIEINDLIDIAIGDNNIIDSQFNSGNNGGNGGGETPQPTPAPVVNNYYGPIYNNFFTGPTYNFFPGGGFGGGGNGGNPGFGGGFFGFYNPIIIFIPYVGPGSTVVINITIFNGPVSIAGGAF